MKERLESKLRAFLIAMSIPVFFSSGCIKKAETGYSNNKTFIDEQNFSDDSFENFKQYFTSNELEYTALESLFSDEEITEIINLSKTTMECNFKWDGDIEKVKEIIKNNSIQFLQENNQYISAFYDSQNDSNDAQLNFEYVFDHVLEDLVVNASGNISEDICKFQTLSIVYGDLPDSLLGVYRHNTIILDYQFISEYCGNANIDLTDFLTETLSHELNHVRQIICEDRLQAGQRYDSFAYLEGVIPSFIAESSAESAFYNVNNGDHDICTYSIEREYESLVFLFAICNEDVDLKDYYNAIFDTDLGKFYEFLDCENEEDVYSFYKILGSIDASLGRNEKLDKSIIKNVGDAKKFIGYNYKINLFHHILSDMVDYTCDHLNFSLEDNLTLFKIVRTILVENSYDLVANNNGDLERIYDSEFVTSFKETEDMYYSFLSLCYETDLLEIKNIEKNYADKVMNTISIMSDTNDFTSSVISYQDEASLLLDRFSLLDPVFKACQVNSYDYDTFVEENRIVYEKKK